MVLTLSLYFLNTDRLMDLFTNLALSCICNCSYCLAYEEIMLALFTKDLENADNWNSLDIFVAVNLDIKYNYALMKYNFEEVFCSCLFKKEKDKAE